MELHLHLHSQGTVPCKECTISDEFNVGHLKMLCIQCLSIIDACPDVVDTLISWLIEVSGSVNDLILKLFRPIDDRVYIANCPIRELQISSKKALYNTNVKYLQETGIIIACTCYPRGLGCMSYQFWLTKSDSIVINSSWNFGDLLSNSIEFYFIRYKP